MTKEEWNALRDMLRDARECEIALRPDANVEIAHDKIKLVLKTLSTLGVD